MSNPILLAPGPVQLHPEVQKILAQPMIHHRTPEFDTILAQTFSDLKFLFQTARPVLMHTSTGTGGMESALVNLLNPNDHVLAIVSGKFGERWADMAEVFGAKVHRLTCAWGEAVDSSLVEQHLKNNPQTKLVLCQACETSTATVHPIVQLAEIVSRSNALFVVDGITAVGAFPIPMDELKIDVLVAGSQKGVMLPTGLSFVSFSEKAWPFVLTGKTPRYYFDARKELKANLNGETLFSSAVPLIKALHFVLSEIKTMTLPEHFRQIKRRADFTREMITILNLKLYSKSPSDSVTAIELPEGLNGVELRNHLEAKYQITVMGGQDQAKGKIIRMGHMGYILDEHLIRSMHCFSMVLKDFNFPVDPEVILQASINWLKTNP